MQTSFLVHEFEHTNTDEAAGGSCRECGDVILFFVAKNEGEIFFLLIY
jgi:hypothetical protein